MSKQSIVTGLLVCGLFGVSVQGDAATSDSQTATSAPSPTKQSPGETQIAVALAKAELSKLGITQPTSTQLSAALNGGTVTGPTGVQTHLNGVLSERSAGLGWGQIAHEMGLRLGDVVSAAKTERAGRKDGDSDARDSNGRDHSDASHAAAGNGAGNGGSGGNHGGKK